MHGTTILQAALTHRSFLSHTGVTPIRIDQDLLGPTHKETFAHGLWLVEQVPAFVASERLEKAQRWLCFVQGMLWAEGLVTTRALKEVMRPPGSVYDAQV